MENVKTEVRDGLLIVTIDRPKVLNALNAQTVDEIHQAFLAAHDDENVKAVIVTGGGESAFVSGADINDIRARGRDEGLAAINSSLFAEIERFPRPTIAAINGYALGGGCELALACHIRIASDKAQIGLPEVTLGIIPGYGGTQRLARLVGKGKALEIICTADRVNAADAEKIGLVNKVVPGDQLMSTAEEMARKIASRGPVAVRCALEAVMSGSEMPFEEGQFLEATLFGLLCATDDMKEGMNAFLEKRAANFTGK